jgi:hypothetical protein
MAFNGLQPSSGPFWLGPHQSTDITMWYGNPGDDHGAQWIMAHPLKGQPPTALQVSNFRKILGYEIAWVNSEGDSGFDKESAYYRYAVTVTNLGNQGVFFNVQGGGNN